MVVAVGLDEAGAGPAFGSLWAGAVHLATPLPSARDSKTLGAKRREALRVHIEAHHPYGLGEVTCTEIDALGMGEARRLAFERARDDYSARGGPPPDMIHVDGTLYRPWKYEGHEVPFQCQPQADRTVPCVSAASILAKTHRDAQVAHFCDAHPELDVQYALRSNKGYLSPAHIAGLRAHGRSPWHRASFHIRALDRDTFLC